MRRFLRDTYEHGATAVEVIETERSPIDTGIVDQYGHRILNCKEEIRFGFVGQGRELMAKKKKKKRY